MHRNIALFPWFKFVQHLNFWQATWFLYFESRLSAAEAILLFVVVDVSLTVLEVPSGYMSDRLGRRRTLLVSSLCYVGATSLLVIGDGFSQFALANVLLGAAWAFASGTDSSLLFESLKAEDRASEVEAMELKAWRYSFAALALSALSGGALAMFGQILPYVATAVAALLLLTVTLRLQESASTPQAGHRENLAAIWASLRQPTLLWLLGMSVSAYIFLHIPFVFGQPFIREALTSAGYEAQTPLVSGIVTFLIMSISLAVSHLAPRLRSALGLQGILLVAFAIQVFLTIALAVSNNLVVVGLLLLRMVPESLSSAFILARIQPLLSDSIRATYLSLQSLAGRVAFSIMLSIAALYTPTGSDLAYADMQPILIAFAALGIVLCGLLTITARKARV